MSMSHLANIDSLLKSMYLNYRYLKLLQTSVIALTNRLTSPQQEGNTGVHIC